MQCLRSLTFAMARTKLYVSDVTLSTQDNGKELEQVVSYTRYVLSNAEKKY